MKRSKIRKPRKSTNGKSALLGLGQRPTRHPMLGGGKRPRSA